MMPHSLASWELDLVLFCIAIRAKTLSSREFAFLGPPMHGLSLALPAGGLAMLGQNSADITLAIVMIYRETQVQI